MASRNGNGNRIQTTVNISQSALDSLDGLSKDSLVSRSKLVDLAIRRFTRWASGVSAKELKLIVDYEVSEQTGALRRRRMSSLPPSMAEPEETEHDEPLEQEYELVPRPIVRAPRPLPTQPLPPPRAEQPARHEVKRRRNRGGRYE